MPSSVNASQSSDVISLGYYEVTYEGVVYSYLINKSRKLFKKNIKKINIEEDNGKTCLTPNDLYTAFSNGTADATFVSPATISASYRFARIFA